MIIKKEELLRNLNFYLKEIETGKIFIYPTDTIYGMGCFDIETAEKYYSAFEGYVVDIKTNSIYKKSCKFKLKYKKSEISFIDAIGYVLAKNLGTKFVTGDKEFEKFENVEFIK